MTEMVKIFLCFTWSVVIWDTLTNNPRAFPRFPLSPYPLGKGEPLNRQLDLESVGFCCFYKSKGMRIKGDKATAIAHALA